jgi:hypothetical protein
MIPIDKLISILGPIIGSGGLSVFLTQRMMRNTNVHIEELKPELEHRRSISKSQIDIEMSVYQKLWEAISNFVVHLNTFVAIPSLALKILPENRLKFIEELVDVNFANLLEPHNTVASIVQNNQPFMSEEIYLKAIDFATKATGIYGELLAVGDHAPNSEQWWEIRSQWSDEMTAASEAIASLIRRRIASW